MTDSTNVTLPAAQAFLSGKLEMPVNIQPGAGTPAPAWADYPANHISAMVFVILMLLTFKMLMRMFPYLLDCVSRWKACVNIDASIRLKSDRNLLGAIWVMPLVLIFDRYGTFNIGFIDNIHPQWHVFATAGIFAIWFLLRLLGFALCSFKVKKPETLRTAHKCIYNYTIVIAPVMTVLVGVFSMTNLSDVVGMKMVHYCCIAFYLLNLLREKQILGTFCGQFRSFLYLCALEILPTGVLIAANILL